MIKICDYDIEQMVRDSKERRKIDELADLLFAPCFAEVILEPVKDALKPAKRERILYPKREESK